MQKTCCPFYALLFREKVLQVRVWSWTLLNIFTVRMDFDSVLFVCTDAIKQEILFLPLIANMRCVSTRKEFERYFGGLCGFIIMFESCVIFQRNKFVYVDWNLLWLDLNSTTWEKLDSNGTLPWGNRAVTLWMYSGSNQEQQRQLGFGSNSSLFSKLALVIVNVIRSTELFELCKLSFEANRRNFQSSN